MTLSTLVVLHEWTGPIELHTWFNANVLGVADKNPIIHQTDTSIRNELGQGFDAIFEVEWEKDGAPLVWYDRAEEEERMARHVPSIYTAQEAADEVASMAAYYEKYPEGVIKIDWDTGYAFKDEHGGCSDLHARYIVRLAKEYLEPRGITFAWQNEYSGEWNEGLTGFEEFGRAGADAGAWFANVALPAIALDVFGGRL